MLATTDYPAGWSRVFFERCKAALEQGWTAGRGIRRSVPSAGPDERLIGLRRGARKAPPL
jgi:hypothetical protein